jgi:hypothetical protein
MTSTPHNGGAVESGGSRASGASGGGAGMIELAEVIGELRRELQEVLNAGEGEQLRFELGPAELEATVAVEKSGGGGPRSGSG